MSIGILCGYIDPTSGSLAVQFVIAAAASGALVFRRTLFWPIAATVRLLKNRRSRRAASALRPGG